MPSPHCCSLKKSSLDVFSLCWWGVVRDLLEVHHIPMACSHSAQGKALCRFVLSLLLLLAWKLTDEEALKALAVKASVARGSNYSREIITTTTITIVITIMMMNYSPTNMLSLQCCTALRGCVHHPASASEFTWGLHSLQQEQGSSVYSV